MIRQKHSNTCATICLLLMLIAAAAHITYGALFIKLGQYNQDQTGSSQLYMNTLPLGSFTITVGCLMVVSIIWLRAVMQSRMNKQGEFAYWFITCMIGVFNFAVAFSEIRQYVYQDKTFTKFHVPIPTNSQFTAPYYLGLADGIYSFLITLPASIELIYLANYRMVEATYRDKIIIDPNPNPEQFDRKTLTEKSTHQPGIMKKEEEPKEQKVEQKRIQNEEMVDETPQEIKPQQQPQLQEPQQEQQIQHSGAQETSPEPQQRQE